MPKRFSKMRLDSSNSFVICCLTSADDPGAYIGIGPGSKGISQGIQTGCYKALAS